RPALRAAAAPPCRPLRGGRNSAALSSAPVHPHTTPRAKVPAPEVGGAFTRRCAPRPAGGGCAAVPPAMRVVEPAGVLIAPAHPRTAPVANSPAGGRPGGIHSTLRASPCGRRLRRRATRYAGGRTRRGFSS